MGETWKKGTIYNQGGYTPKNGEPRVLPLHRSITYKYDTSEDLVALFDLHADQRLSACIEDTSYGWREEICL